MEAAAGEIKKVFVKASKTPTEVPPKKITKSRRVLPKAKAVKKTAKATMHTTFPVGVMKGTRQTRRAKLVPSSNPTTSPPLKRDQGNRGTLRVLTDVGERKQYQAASERTSRMTDEEMRADLTKAGHHLSPKAPSKLVREIHTAAALGGFLK